MMVLSKTFAIVGIFQEAASQKYFYNKLTNEYLWENSFFLFFKIRLSPMFVLALKFSLEIVDSWITIWFPEYAFKV